MMRLRPLLLVLGALIFVSGTVRAVDRGQFENVPDDIRAWFKGVRSPAGVPCCDISDGHRTEYDVRAGAYWVPINGSWWRVPEKAIIRNAGNPLGEAVVWYGSLRGNIEIRRLSASLNFRRCPSRAGGTIGSAPPEVICFRSSITASSTPSSKNSQP